MSAGSYLAAARLGLRPVLWTAWGRDWEATATPRSVIDTLRRGGLWPGGTSLLHDSDRTCAPGSRTAALAAPPEVAAECQAPDARFATLRGHLT